MPEDRLEKIQNPDFIKAVMRVVENDNPDARKSIYNAFLKGTFITLAGTKPGDGSFGYVVIKADGGGSAIIVFSDKKALTNWAQKAGYKGAVSGLSGAEFAKFCLENSIDSIIVNPAGPCKGEITKREICIMLGKHPAEAARSIVAPGTIVCFGPPAVQPGLHIMEAVNREAENREEIAAVYIFEAAIGDNRPQLTIGVEFKPGMNRRFVEKTLEDMGLKIVDSSKEGVKAHLIELKPSDLLTQVKKLIHPVFYR